MADIYKKNTDQKLFLKLKTLQMKLPDFTQDFFRGISDQTQIKTRIAYAFDLRIFFYFLITENELFKNRNTTIDFKLKDLDRISAIDIEKFSEFLTNYSLPHYKNQQKIINYTNSAKGKMRKLSTLRSLYAYYYKKELIKTNPTVLVDLPKLHEKPIIRLEPDEVVKLLDAIETGDRLTKGQLKYHNKTSSRDLAIISLLLGTGIRISECVGLNIHDFDFENNSFKIIRKGGNQTILYLPDEVKNILLDYLKNNRCDMIPINEEDLDAMFISLQKKRMTASSITKMLKKYTKFVTPLKNISPHKLRSTFGTNLYRETGDIYLVADVLGHKDVNTTKKHYAAIDEERRRIAAKVTKLRED